MDKEILRQDERLDFLIDKRIRIIQHLHGFCFSMDSVLLANFATVRRGDQVCDLGTGTGVIPLILADRTQAKCIYGLEIQESMVDMAKRSVVLNGMESRICIQHGDIRNGHTLYGSSVFDVVTANPPYMEPVRGANSQSMEIAIARQEILCTLKDVLLASSRIVKSKGRVVLVHRPQRLTDIFCIMRSVHLEPKRIQFVHPKNDVSANIVLIEAVKDGGMELNVLEPLVVHQEDGHYTDAIKKIYYDSGGDIIGER